VRLEFSLFVFACLLQNKCAKLAIAVLAASEGAEKSVGRQKINTRKFYIARKKSEDLSNVVEAKIN
jgi:hypothetical protein